MDKCRKQLTDVDLEWERDLESLEPHQQHPAHARSVRALAKQHAIENANVSDARERTRRRNLARPADHN